MKYLLIPQTMSSVTTLIYNQAGEHLVGCVVGMGEAHTRLIVLEF